MSEKDNGGLFYPYHESTGTINIQEITRRDWLAGLAMQGLLSGSHYSLNFVDKELQVALNKAAYEIADEMIKEGKR